MESRENVPGCDYSVDHSDVTLRQGGQGPSPQGALPVPPEGHQVETGGEVAPTPPSALYPIPPDKKVLYLTLYKEWFEPIASGQKSIEYRDVKPYWEKRLRDKTTHQFVKFHLIVFRVGYALTSPTVIVEHEGTSLNPHTKDQYFIHLGKVVFSTSLTPHNNPTPADTPTLTPPPSSAGVGVSVPLSPFQSGLEQPDPVVSFFVGEPPVILNSTANLEGFEPLLPLYPPSHCSPKYLVLQCTCGRRIVPSTCMSLDCEICQPHVGRRRSQSVLRRLLLSSLYQRRKHQRTNVIMTVFTLPPAIREYYFDRKRWQRLRGKVWKILKENFGALYGVEASHPHGDKNPNAFHPHMNFLWVQRAGYRPFLNATILRELWSGLLNVPTADVYSQYSNRIPQIAHWCKYVTRTFPGTHAWTGPLRWFGKYPKSPHPEKVTCCDCGSHFRVIGYVYATDVDAWYERGMLQGIDPPWERDSHIIPFRPPVKATQDAIFVP